MRRVTINVCSLLMAELKHGCISDKYWKQQHIVEISYCRTDRCKTIEKLRITYDDFMHCVEVVKDSMERRLRDTIALHEKFDEAAERQYTP